MDSPEKVESLKKTSFKVPNDQKSKNSEILSINSIDQDESHSDSPGNQIQLGAGDIENSENFENLRRRHYCPCNQACCCVIENSIYICVIFGVSMDLVCIIFWTYLSTLHQNVASFYLPRQPHIIMIILHLFCIVSNFILLFATTMENLPLCLSWLVIRGIWFFYALLTWIRSFDVFTFDNATRPNNNATVIVTSPFVNNASSTIIGKLLEPKGLGFPMGDESMTFSDTEKILWNIAFFAYWPLIFIYSGITFLVIVYTCALITHAARKPHQFPPTNRGVSYAPDDDQRRLTTVSFNLNH